MRASSLVLVLTALLGVSFLLQTTVSAQTTYITVYGQLAFSSCTSTLAIPPTCQSFFFLTTNGTTSGIPAYPKLDFTQNVSPPPSQSDVGKTIAATGHYGDDPSGCPVANGCQAFFVYTWGPYFGSSVSLPTTTGCFTSSNSPTIWVSVQCVTAPTIPLGGATAQGLTPTYPLGPLLLIVSQIIIGAIIILAFVWHVFAHRKKQLTRIAPYNLVRNY